MSNTPDELSDAYVADRRAWLAATAAGLGAAALLLGVLGSAVTWSDGSPLFELTSNEMQGVKIGLDYLAGPALILLALPLRFPRQGQLAARRWFRARLAIAALLWIAGLVVLLDKVSGRDGYTLQAGAYVAAALIVVGLLATLAIWPAGLREVQVNRAGHVREPAR